MNEDTANIIANQIIENISVLQFIISSVVNVSAKFMNTR